MAALTGFRLFSLPGTQLGDLDSVLDELQLRVDTLNGDDVEGGLLILAPGQSPPAGWDHATFELPPDATGGALRQLLRLAMENEVLRSRVYQMELKALRDNRRFAELNRIGIALSAERDINRLQDLILLTCRQLTAADGASLWLIKDTESGERLLRFAWTQNHSLKTAYHEFTMPLNEKSLAGYTVVSGQTQVVEDAYNLPADAPYSFNRTFDQQFGYHTHSMLAVAMRNHEGRIIGAIQLLNAKRDFDIVLTPENTHEMVVPFDHEMVEVIESIAGQAAVALDNKQLLDAIERLFEGFIEASVKAIESRDPVTRGHSGRVAALTLGLAETLNDVGVGAYKDTVLTMEQLRELRYAALLHDFGKVGVRENVLTKEKKLYNEQVTLIQARFAFVKRSRQLVNARTKAELLLGGPVDPARIQAIDQALDEEMDQIQRWLDSIIQANEPTVLDEDKASMLEFLSTYKYEDIDGQLQPLLDPSEFHFLSIKRGTLDENERVEIESHVTHSFEFLSRIPWTPVLSGIPNIAYGHHEKLDGSGYPRKLTAAEIPVQTRMMTISDIYDALTAQDRPYKRAVPLDRALNILEMEAKDGKLDAELLGIFIERRVYDAATNYKPGDDDLMVRE